MVFDFGKGLSRLGDAVVLCVGDLMLDTYVYGEVARISPEAPAPVIAVAREESAIGGAGNVARNVAGLGARCIFVGIVGDDASGRALADAFAREQRIVPHLVTDPSRPTTCKTRYVSEHFSTHLLRADRELARPVDGAVAAAVIGRVNEAIAQAGAVVISDYAKGVLTPKVIQAVIAAARAHGKPVVVDPKGHDFRVYAGATVITPNRKERGEATRRPVSSDAEVATAAAALAEEVGADAVLVTLSEHGLLLAPRGGAAVHMPVDPVKVLDVSGAGDTVVATLAALLALGVTFEPAARAANAAASIVVGKRGTATVSAAELRARILPAARLAPERKILTDPAALARQIAEWRGEGLRIGFTNGCFDIIHPGHVTLLAEARAASDRLIVGLNSDASVRRLKGAGRPVQDERARAAVLARQPLLQSIRAAIEARAGERRAANRHGGAAAEALAA
jgi:D-beta-D-heptose 7-phosphate kinase/D-beta-D-heptose 1-phosphate adenosyltransferase